MATVAVISTGRRRSCAPSNDRFAERRSRVALVVEVRHHDDAVLHGDAEERDEADGARHVERHAAQVERDHAAEQRERHADEDERGVAERAEGAVEQEEDEPEHERQDDREPRLRALLVLELAAPDDLVSLRGRTSRCCAMRACASARNDDRSRPRRLSFTVR